MAKKSKKSKPAQKPPNRGPADAKTEADSDSGSKESSNKLKELEEIEERPNETGPAASAENGLESNGGDEGSEGEPEDAEPQDSQSIQSDNEGLRNVDSEVEHEKNEDQKVFDSKDAVDLSIQERIDDLKIISTDTKDSEPIEIPSQQHATPPTHLSSNGQSNESYIEEISRLKDQIKSLQSSHEEELTILNQKLQQASQSQQESENQYENLRGKISSIKATLGEKLKSDAAELEKCRQEISQLQHSKDSLEQQKQSLLESLDTLKTELISSNRHADNLSHQLSTVREESQAQAETWETERDKLIADVRAAKEKAESSSVLAQDLEIAIMEERSMRGNYNSRIADLEDQINSQTTFAEQFKIDRDTLQDSLTRAEQSLAKSTLENSQVISDLKQENHVLGEKLRASLTELSDMTAKLAAQQKEIQSLSEFERECKEKNLLIGKLRHEAVTLNEHLVKALRLLKKDSEGETVDKQLVTNLFISFLSLPRADTKKFEVLQLISNYLGWDDEQKAQAGLARSSSIAGTGNTAGLSPSATPRNRSITSLNGLSDDSTSGGFMGLFAEFLERESSKRESS